MYKYFCNLSLGLKFGEFYFSFTGNNMPMIKASKIWKKTESFSVGYLCQTPSLFVSKYALYYMYAYIHVVYIERTQGCKFMNLRMHTHIYIKLYLLVIKNFCTIKPGFICKYLSLKQKISLEYMYLLWSRKNRTARVFFPVNRCIKFIFL